MRTKTLSVYETLSANVGTVVSVADIEKEAKGTNGRSVSAEVWVLVNELGMDIETIKDGKTNSGFKMNAIPDPLPARIIKATGGSVTKKAKPAKTKAVTESIPVATETVAKTEVLEVAAKPERTAAQIKKNNRDKIRRAAQKAAKLAAETEAETVEVEATVTELEEFPEFLKREPELAE